MVTGDLELAAEKGRKRDAAFSARRRQRSSVSIRFYLRCGLIYRRSGSRILARALAAPPHYIFPANRTEVHVGKYIGRVPLRRRDGLGRPAGRPRRVLRAPIVDTHGVV